MAESNSKACRRCGEVKLFSAFANNASKHDGLQTWCRQCKVDVQRATRSVKPPNPISCSGKVCSTCKTEKPSSSFSKCVTSADGLQVQCKACKADRHLRSYTPIPRKPAKVKIQKPPKFKPVYPEGHKRCPKCSEVKPATGFNKNKERADGRSVWCKVCHSEKNKEHRSGKLFTGLIADAKTCQKCGEEKNISEFYSHKRDGAQPWCKSCFKKAKAVPEHLRQVKSRVRVPGATYQCCGCKESFTAEMFNKGRRGSLKGTCIPCERKDSNDRKEAKLVVLRARTHKPCKRCKNHLPVAMFDFSHHTSDRYRPFCKACWSKELIERALLNTKRSTYRSTIRYERLRLATPKWSDTKKVRAVYREARKLEKSDGVKRHVDHIIPITGRKVSGLHVSANLQIIKARDNVKKSNKFEIQ